MAVLWSNLAGAVDILGQFNGVSGQYCLQIMFRNLIASGGMNTAVGVRLNRWLA